MVYYLDDFMAVFSASQAKQIWQTCYTYNSVIDILKISKNVLKAVEKTQIKVFRIEIDTKNFTTKLLDEKLEKAVKATGKVLAKQWVPFLNI